MYTVFCLQGQCLCIQISRFLSFFFLLMVLEKVTILIWLFFTQKKIIFPALCCCTIYCKFLFPKVNKRRKINFLAQPSIRNYIEDLVVDYKQNKREQDRRNKALSEKNALWVTKIWEWHYRSYNVRPCVYGTRHIKENVNYIAATLNLKDIILFDLYLSNWATACLKHKVCN